MEYKPVGKVTPARTWNEIKYERMSYLLFCECLREGEDGKVVRCTRTPEEANHVFIKTDKRKQFKKYLDVPENMQIVNKECHPYAHTRKNKELFMEVQKKRYNMQVWFNALPEKKQMTNADIGGLIGFI